MFRLRETIKRLGETLDSRDIIQINATIIAGLLILLSISNLYPLPSPLDIGDIVVTRNSTIDEAQRLLVESKKAFNESLSAGRVASSASVVLYTTIPFALSSIAALCRYNGIAILIMIIGFLVLLWSISYLATINIDYETKKLIEARDLIYEYDRLLPSQ
ncbi:MAG: hypothetical protein DA330_05655 [Nitrososphaera sp.]|nr:hypothetical protein [Nitrososphaera sp.]